MVDRSVGDSRLPSEYNCHLRHSSLTSKRLSNRGREPPPHTHTRTHHTLAMRYSIRAAANSRTIKRATNKVKWTVKKFYKAARCGAVGGVQARARGRPPPGRRLVATVAGQSPRCTPPRSATPTPAGDPPPPQRPQRNDRNATIYHVSTTLTAV